MHFYVELTYLRLVKLDISGNRISVLPNEIRKMKGLVDFRLSDNPLTSPPASVSIRTRFINLFPLKKERERKSDIFLDILRSFLKLTVFNNRIHDITSSVDYVIFLIHRLFTSYGVDCETSSFCLGHFIQNFICEFPNQYPEIIR